MQATKPRVRSKPGRQKQRQGQKVDKAKQAGFSDFVNQIQRANAIDFKPRNLRQSAYADAIRTYDLTFGLGPAGTGKTYVAAAIAAEMKLRGEIDRIILVRPAVAAGGEEHGFLPGDIRKKLAHWARPVTDLLRDFIGHKQFDMMLQEGEIETMPFTYMRGLTFDNAFVLLDEAQNVTREQMQLFLTRIGDDTKVVIDGDVTQTDLPHDGGLHEAVSLASSNQIPVGCVEFLTDDVVRSAMAWHWVKAYDERVG